jgi:hypothetical protein
MGLPRAPVLASAVHQGLSAPPPLQYPQACSPQPSKPGSVERVGRDHFGAGADPDGRAPGSARCSSARCACLGCRAA